VKSHIELKSTGGWRRQTARIKTIGNQSQIRMLYGAVILEEGILDGIQRKFCEKVLMVGPSILYRKMTNRCIKELVDPLVPSAKKCLETLEMQPSGEAGSESWKDSRRG
jgi:hypothetical protein